VSYQLLQRSESKQTSQDAPLVKELTRKIKEVLCIDARPVGIGGGTVGAFLRNADIDSVAWSPIDDTAHQPNEYVLLKNILNGAKVMAAMME
jgi:succinyl-diaminopimelate desuccinylase